MSKLVVDQIQKSGGPSLTLPTTSGAANAMLVNDGSGNLGLTTLGNLLPGGAANTVLTNDGAGNLSFATPILVPADNNLLYGSVMTASARSNVYSTGEWTTSGPNSSYFSELGAGSDVDDTHQSFNMFLGDGYPNGTSQQKYAADFRGLENRTILYSNGNRLGPNYRELFYYENSTSYGGTSWHIMPVRNTTNAPIVRSLSFMYSSYGSYVGAALGTYTPNAAVYSATTGGSWTQAFTTTSQTITNTSASITIPANTTVLVMLITSHNYQTTYYFKESSMFFGLNNFFGTGLVCDQRMLHALATLRTPSATNSVSAPHEIYTGCAAVYGDR
jgi:hypothetical protein